MLVVQDLGVAGASYVRRYLEANSGFGKQLGKLLLDRFDVALGSVWAFVPHPLPSERKAGVTDFEAGGLLLGKGERWREEVNAWVSRTVGAAPHFLVTEHALSRPTDPFVSKLEGWHFFCQDSVFDCFELPPNRDVARQLSGATWDPDVTILTPRPAFPPKDRAAVPPAALAALVEQSIAVGVGAWDDEGAVFWEPGRFGPQERFCFSFG